MSGAEDPAVTAAAAARARPLPRDTALWVALGGAAGVLLNTVVGAAVGGLAGGDLPGFDTVLPGALPPVLPLAVVNLLGSFLLGLLTARARTASRPWNPRVLPALGTGLLGSFTSVGAVCVLLALPLGALGFAVAPGGASIGSLALPALMGLAAALVCITLMTLLGTLAAALGLRAGGVLRPRPTPPGGDGPHGPEDRP